MTDRVTIKMMARERVKADWGMCIGTMAIYYVMSVVLTAATIGIGSFFLVPPLMVGVSIFFLGIWRNQSPTFEALFGGFQRYAQSLLGILWMYLWTFLWSLLFVIPGIVKTYAYSMTPYLLADHPEMNWRNGIRVSQIITRGHKMEIFIMQLSFLGWLILSGFTMGILYVVYVGPYMETAMAGLYEGLLHDALESGTLTEDDMYGWYDSYAPGR